MIGARPFKVACYFLPSLVHVTPKLRDKFDFDCIFVQAFNVSLDKTFEIVLTEHDIATLIEMI